MSPLTSPERGIMHMVSSYFFVYLFSACYVYEPINILFFFQAFCDSNLHFVMISSKLCSSTNDNTSYIVTQLSKDIKAGLLPEEYHVVLDEAYPCTEQEMSPWKGRNLPTEKDAFNY